MTVFDELDERYPPWESWLDRIGPSGGPPNRNVASYQSSEFSRVKSEVKSARPGLISTKKGEILSEAIIMATGSRFDSITFPGKSKPGVIALDVPGSLAEAGRMEASDGKVVICGEGEGALQVADRLALRRIGSRVAVTHWKNGPPSPAVGGVIASAAKRAGVAIFEGKPERALGVGKLEAVEFDVGVTRCDTLVIVPGRHPSPPPTGALPGRGGGVLVDSRLRSSVPTLFAAGGCAEIEGGLPPNASLGAEAVMSGRLAGGNASGGGRRIQLARVTERLVFGLRWCTAGARFPRPAFAPSLSGFASQAWRSSGCTLVFLKKTGRVVGVETVDHVSEKTGDIGSLVSEGETLESLAFWGSTDISLISETARVGLRPWSRS